MEKRTRRTFSKAFKEEALRMCEMRPKSEVARSLDIHENLLYKWTREARDSGSEAFRGRGNRTAVEEENRHLRLEVARLREEAEILKKASAYFAKHLR